MNTSNQNISQQRIDQVVEGLKEQIWEISSYIFQHPELGDEEHQSCGFLVKILKENGFRVTHPYMGLETAFRAEYGDEDGPSLAYLAEYDALPGYGPEKMPAHACGHNWIAAHTVGTALVLARMKEDFRGKVVVFGTPAEETTGRKIDMANGGAFDDIDAAFQFHLYESTNLKARALAMDSVEFEFIGKASHAAVYPHEGVNALDAVQLTFNGVSFLRQQLKDDVRIHGIVTEGGEAPNIIPDRCKCLFYVRAARKSYFQQVLEKVKNCGRGAALMTGAELRINMYENAYDDLIVNPVLAQLTEKNLLAAGFGELSQDEEIPGSTDIGNVSYKCPTLYGNIGIAQGKIKVHEEEFVELANGDEAKEILIKAVKALCYTALELYSDSEKLREVRVSFENSIAE